MVWNKEVKRDWMQELLLLQFFHGSRKQVLIRAGTLIVVIGAIDWHFEDNISFGFLYLFPMLSLGGWLSPFELALVAALCTGLTEAFDPFPWSMPIGISRLVLTFAAFFGTGFLGMALARSRQTTSAKLEEMKEEAQVRRETEEQLEYLISSSPAAIFTLDETGRVQLANESAHKIFHVQSGKLQGQLIGRFIPALASVPSSHAAPFFHTEMECRARREDAEVFLAHIWFSTYQTMAGPRLAAVVFDSSEELRDRAEFNLEQILTGSKVLVGALCHEIRNISGAIAMVHTKLSREKQLMFNEDFGTLGTLVQALEKMAGLELRQTARASLESVDILSVLEELRIVIEPSFEDAGIKISWEQDESLPRVLADRHAVLQVFLNVAKNSERALEGCLQKELVVRAQSGMNSVVVRFIDSGPGVADPNQLFTPFQPGAQASGLGLYLSRTFLRSFRGEIEYEPVAHGACFVITLCAAQAPDMRLP